MGAVKFKNKNPDVSPFLGIGEGKSKAAKAAAEVAIESAKRETLMAEQMALLAGANVAAAKAAAEASVINAKAVGETSVLKADAGSNTNLYLIVGGIVAVLMAGLYFIIKARKK